MGFQDQIELEQSASAAQHPRSAAGVKTILLHVQNDTSLERRLETSLSMARACDAHLSCLHVTPIEAYVAFDSFGGVFVMNDIIKTLDEEEQEVRARVEEELRNEDVSWDYEQVTGNVCAQLASHGALADLVVTGREPHRADFAAPAMTLMGDLLYRARTPLFIVGEDAVPTDPTGVALIAWNGSFEAANAVRSAVGLLSIAKEVRVLHVSEDKDQDFPSTKLLEYLSRRGIHAQLSVEPTPRHDGGPDFVSVSLLAHAAALNAAYIVMGGYSHSRIGEFVFGGVTRTMLGGCPIPLVMAH